MHEDEQFETTKESIMSGSNDPYRTLVPVSLLETLIDAARRSYRSASEGRNAELEMTREAARAAESIIERHRRHGRVMQGPDGSQYDLPF